MKDVCVEQPPRLSGGAKVRGVCADSRSRRASPSRTAEGGCPHKSILSRRSTAQRFDQLCAYISPEASPAEIRIR